MANNQRRVNLTLTDPKKEGKMWAVRVIVTITEGKDPIEGQEVEFFLEGESAGKLSSDADGRTICDISIPDIPGKYLVEAKCSGVNRTEQRKITIPEPTKKKASVKILVTPTQEGLEHTLFCRALTIAGDSEKPFEGAVLILFDNEQELERTTTSEAGTATFKLHLESSKKEKIVRIIVAKTAITQVVHLFQ
jgi:hypothetical protein